MDDVHNTLKKAKDALQYAMECRAALHGKALDAKAQLGKAERKASCSRKTKGFSIVPVQKSLSKLVM